MPGKVLRQHNIVSYSDGHFELDVSKFSKDEKNEIITICDDAIAKYEEKYGKTK